MIEDKEIVFEDEKELNAKDLLTDANMDFDFNKLYSNNKATKSKFLTKKQRKTRNKMVKTSRRKNRH